MNTVMKASTRSQIDTHLMSLRAVGIIENAGVSLDENDNLVQAVCDH